MSGSRIGEGRLCSLASLVLVFSCLGRSQTLAPPPSTDQGRTVLIAAEGHVAGAARLVDMGPGKMGWVQSWNVQSDSVSWRVQVEHTGDYEISAILESSGAECAIALAIDGRTLRDDCGEAGWNRVRIPGTIHLESGQHAFQVSSSGKTPLSKFFSLEFVLPQVSSRLAALAKKEQVSTSWMVEAKYGLMFHWTSQSKPRAGAAKPYCDAVRDFDVSKFADMVSETGAGFVIFTTSHAEMYFPGPNPVIDDILPGRTCPRDLVGDLAEALGQRQIRLELYFHPGHDDRAWWNRTHFDESDKTAYFQLWRKVIAQIGRQYGRRLAGFWFDDAAFTYYPFNPSWQELAEAARTGNSDRVLSFNSWILPKLSDFYDVYAGENAGWEPQYELHQDLPIGGTGRYTGGPQHGLQAEVLALLNDDWGHFKINEPISPPRISASALVTKMEDAISRKEVPVLDAEVYQDGSISPETLHLLESVRKEFPGSSHERSR